MRAALVVLALVAGCAKQGTELTAWTIETRGTSVAVSLPTNLKMVGDAPFALRTEVRLAPAQRGRSLALVLDCYHGALAASANGVALADDSDGGNGSWRFAIPAAATAEENVTLESAHLPSLTPGESIRIAFTDTVCGIAAEEQEKIFDPYFTTKTSASGLGLASV